MCARRHTGPLRAGLQSEWLASDRHAVGDAVAFLLVLLATAAAGLAVVGVLHAIAWLVGAMSHGQMVSGLMAAAGGALLALVLLGEAPSRMAKVKARVRAVVVGALMMAAGLALLLVHRLDPTALPRALAGLKAAMWSAIVAERSRR